jgi:tyrosinase
VRRDISRLPVGDPTIQTYKAAVSAMKALPSTDPRNWTRQAQIHFDHCPHGNWYFLPWHRAYLLFFEEICRELTGNKDFALPYWNWTANPSIPAVFWGGASNPLFDGSRFATPASVADGGSVGAGVLDSILNEPNFFTFASGQVTGQRDFGTYGRLEGTPHNYIHGFVGGDMGNYMSPLDPLFWTHHNMIECCWVEWNLDRHHPNTNSSQWMNFSFSDFVDKNGSLVNVTVVDTLLDPIFAYRFEPCAPGEGAPRSSRALKRADAEALIKFAKEGAPVRWDFLRRFELRQALEVEVGKPAGGSIKLDPAQFRSAVESSGPSRLLLILGGVELPSEADYFVRVFLNKPDASLGTSIEDPHYAGSFTFFFDGRHALTHGAPKAGFVVDVTDTLRRLNRSGTLSRQDQVDVHLVPVPFERRQVTGQRFKLQRLEVGITKVSQ